MPDEGERTREKSDGGAKGPIGERRWPMALAVLACGVLRILLPTQLRDDDARYLFLTLLVVLLAVLMIGDPGRIDRQRQWLRVMTDVMISVITIVNATAVIRLTVGIVNGDKFSEDPKSLLAAGAAVWLTNILAFTLWYWDLDRGGAAARANGSGPSPAFIFPEDTNPGLVPAGWYPKFVDYLSLSFSSATACSPADVSPVKSWAKLVMMAEESISLVVAIFVIARAVNILK